MIAQPIHSTTRALVAVCGLALAACSGSPKETALAEGERLSTRGVELQPTEACGTLAQPCLVEGLTVTVSRAARDL